MYNIDWSVYYAPESFDVVDVEVDDVISRYERELWDD
jgi:hypothetical protein